MRITKLLLVAISLFLFLPFSQVNCQVQTSSSAPEFHQPSNPLLVDLNIRKKTFEKGNLVSNPSFEDAEILKNDSLIKNFNLKSWAVVGDKVELTDTSNTAFYKSDEVFAGKRAVKIVHEKSDAKRINKKSDGVESDFIEVIPGNYDFNFQIRLENIISPNYPGYLRRIDKGINIRLKFYDENKKEMSPLIYYHFLRDEIDNGFKGVGFSNYFYIDKFEWGKVRGDTWHYPFSEGDIPEGCKYVKIYFGLDIQGTMWVDDVNFSYSKWNFTPKERIVELLQKSYELPDLLLPTPKSISAKRKIDFSKSGGVSVIIANSQSTETKMIFKTLTDRFTGKETRLSNRKNSKDLNIQFISDGDKLFADLFSKIKEKTQGYFLHYDKNVIYVGAYTSTGWYNGTTTLAQLINTKTQQVEFAEIVDYPDFTGRTARLFPFKPRFDIDRISSLSDADKETRLNQREKNLEMQLDYIDFYSFYKINVYYGDYQNPGARWWQPGEFYKKYYSTIGEHMKEYGSLINLAVQANPYLHLEGMFEKNLTDSIKNIFAHNSEESFNQYISILKPGLENGANVIMVCADDYVARHENGLNYTLFNDADKKEFGNLAGAQAYFLNKLKVWLDKNYPGTRIEFVPPYYNTVFMDVNNGAGIEYFKVLKRQLDSSIVLVWTGNVVRSLTYDAADMDYITKFYGPKPMIWDNTPYARTVEAVNGGYPVMYPERSMLCNLFEPFDIDYPKDFQNDVDPYFYTNNSGLGEANKIKNITYSDFTWNTNGYDPDLSLVKAMIQYVGKENAKALLDFNDAYFDYVSSWGKLKVALEKDAGYVVSEGEKRIADQKLRSLEKAFKNIEHIDRPELVKEMKGNMDYRVKRWNSLVEKASPKG